MLYKRNGIYHCDFTVNGQRYRRSLDTTDWREAGNKEKDLIKNAQDGSSAARLKPWQE